MNEPAELLPFPAEPTVSSVVASALAHVDLRLSLGQIDPTHAYRFRHYLNSLAEHCGPNVVKAGRGLGEGYARPSDLISWLARHPTWQSGHTKADAIRCVVSAFRWAEEEGLIDRNPYRRPRDLRLDQRPRNPITHADYRRLVRATYPKAGERRLVGATQLRQCIRFLWRTGARTCELRSIQWEHVRWDCGVIVLDQHKTSRKTGEPRVIALDPWLLRYLRLIHAQQPRRQRFVFVNSRGKPWKADAFEGLFRSFADRAGLPMSVSAYSLRHGFCVRMIVEGKTDRQTADLLGHRGTQYVNWYGRATKQRFDYLTALIRK